jgi:hypothetical protein
MPGAIEPRKSLKTDSWSYFIFKAGIGVWFEHGNSFNVSRAVYGSVHTNNTAEIQASENLLKRRHLNTSIQIRRWYGDIMVEANGDDRRVSAADV